MPRDPPLRFLPVHTIIFDIGRTLLPFSFDPIREQLAPCRAAAQALIDRIEAGNIDAAEFQAAMCALTGVAVDAFPAWWNSIFGAAAQHLVPPAWIRELRRHYRLGLLSNTNALHFVHLERLYPLLAGFDFRILSYEVGAEKPHQAIYTAAEEQAQCAPAQILYFDDVPEFVAAAQRRGWRAEVFTGAATLLAALQAHGVACSARLGVGEQVR